ncbi:alpha/beta hydrolase [Aquisphaera insulae]|uniref:alpha/beta hydrolase n=1 Tax=Aquisphaera insulae TaxID=2712864 RepID=UPI0013EE1C89|nr:alpha/beta hydrolase [Aquisphaera insulae]
MWIRPLLWLALGLLVGRLWMTDPGRWSGRAVRAGQSLEANVPYKSDLRISILAAEEPGSTNPSASIGLRKAILAVHGGDWIGGSSADYVLQLGRLAEHGYVLFAADYSLARPGQPSWPAAIDDLRESVRWIRRNAVRYRVDPDRIAIVGSGAGGHLALILGHELAADAGNAMKVQAVVSLYGPTDLEGLILDRQHGHEAVRTFLGGGHSTALETARAASPIRQVDRSSPPTLLIHGLDDAWVGPEHSITYARALRDAGVFHRLLLIPAARHGFELQLGPPSSEDLLPAVLDFLSVSWQTGLPKSTDLPTLSD